MQELKEPNLTVTHMHVGFKVKDYGQWKHGYGASIKKRKAAGEVSLQVLREAGHPNAVTVISVQEDADQVTAVLESPELKARMEASGIVAMGRMLIMEEMDRRTHRALQPVQRSKRSCGI